MTTRLLLVCAMLGCSSVTREPSGDGGGRADSGHAVVNDAGPRPDRAVMPAVGDCTSLGAPGVFERVSPPELFGVTNVVLDPFTPGTLYIGSEPGGIYRSNDCGSSWTKVNVGTNGEIVDSGMNWVLLLSPDEPGVMYTNAFEGEHLGLLRSNNAGRDWALSDDFYAQSASIDPNDSRHLVQTIHDKCGCMRESIDGGATWRTTGSPAEGFTEGAGPLTLGPNRWLYMVRGESSLLTEDGGASYRMVANDGGGHYFRTADGTLYVGGLGGIIRSRDDGHTFEMLRDSPRALAIVAVGNRLFGGYVWDETERLFWSDNMGEGPWNEMAVPSGFMGPAALAYDAEHHVLYSANGIDGGALWRVVME